MKKSGQYSPEVRERAVRMVLDHQKDYGSQWEAIVAISARRVVTFRPSGLLRTRVAAA